MYRQAYGSPEVDQTTPKATKAVVSEDGLRVNVTIDGLVQGHVHDFYLPEMRSIEDEKLLHASAYYTLNEIPKRNSNARVDDEPEQQTHPVPQNPMWLTYSGAKAPENSPGKGKHIVLIAAEQEYRSEQSMPMLARILSEQHGFDCTVLFSVNEQGQVDPTLPAPFKDKTKRHNIPGLKYLGDADCLIWISRFMHLPDEQMDHFHNYFDSGKPIIALRTANHGFMGGKKYLKDGKPVGLRQLLGGTFMGHHGGWHRESTRGIIVEENKSHPILIGVKDIWGTSDVYRCHNEKNPMPDDCTPIVLGQPLISLEPDAPANADKEPLPVAWTKTWIGDKGKRSKVFPLHDGVGQGFRKRGRSKIDSQRSLLGLGHGGCD